MGRKRVIDTDELLFDEDLYSAIGEHGLWLYVRLWSLAEDWGGYEPKYGNIALKMGVLRMSTEDVKTCIESLINLGKIIPYEVNGKSYHWVKNLLKHQPLNNPSPPSIPLPPWITCEIKEYASKKKYASYRIDWEKLASYTSSLPVVYQEYPKKPPKPKSKYDESATEKHTLTNEDNSENQNQILSSLPVALETKRNETETRKALSAEPPPSLKISPKELSEVWNKYAPEYLPRVTSMSDKRAKKLSRGINGFNDLLWWRNLFQDIDLSPFYSGKDGKWQGMDFDWAILNHEKLRQKLDRASHFTEEQPQWVRELSNKQSIN